MHHISRQALVRYTAAQMFGLVEDIESYPKFLPWCRVARIVEREEGMVKAHLTLAKGAIEKSFTTINRSVPHGRIDISLVEGPFHSLEGVWLFEDFGPQGSKVSLDLRFEFLNPLLRFTLGPVFHQIANTLVDAFVHRARQIYGEGVAP